MLLVVAASLCGALAVAHSYLGERFVVRRMLRRDQPRLFGSDDFTKRTLRFQWHLLSVAWVGMGALLVVVPESALVVGVAMLASAGIALAASRGKHLAWIVMAAIGGLAVGA